MNSKKFSEAMSGLDSKYVDEALNYKKKAKKTVWVKWGTVAACLCLVIAGAVIVSQQISNPAPDDNDAGEGGKYSVAVYPANESGENVASAEVVSLTESEALSNPLAEHLPSQLPDGFHYGRGSVYNTVMKDGTQYNMLRIEYITGVITEQQYTEDGGAIAPDADAMGEFFTICVMNYEPETKIGIYSSDEKVTLSVLEESGAVYIRSGDCYVGVFTETAEPALVLETVRNVMLSQINDNNSGDTVMQVYTLSRPAQMEVRLVEWQSEGFKAVVTDVGDNTVYPEGAELTVIFDEETEIVLSDGTFFGYSSDEPQAEAIGWAVGETVLVKFQTYEEYLEGNDFYNHVYASHVEIK